MLDEETVPLDEGYLPLVLHHGREYQEFALENLHYFEPIDEDEIIRLKIVHQVLGKTLNGRLLPPQLTRPRKILECGAGAGDWAIETARSYPACEVVAVDVSPHMWPLEELPANLHLQVDDVNERFTWPKNEFDLVHSQQMVGVINKDRWRSYLRDIFRTLRPGGWCEMVEMYYNAQSDNGTLTDAHELRRWSKNYMESIQSYKDPRAPLRLASWMRETGFVVSEEPRPIPLPTCGWPSDAKQKEIGIMNRENIRYMLSSLALYPMTALQGLDHRDFEVQIAQARREADNPALKTYFSLYVCRGQKPR